MLDKLHLSDQDRSDATVEVSALLMLAPVELFLLSMSVAVGLPCA